MIFLIGLYLTSVCHGHNVNGAHSSLHLAFLIHEEETEVAHDTQEATGNEHDTLTAHSSEAERVSVDDLTGDYSGPGQVPGPESPDTLLCSVGPANAAEGSFFVVGAVYAVLLDYYSMQTVFVVVGPLTQLRDQLSLWPEERPPRVV